MGIFGKLKLKSQGITRKSRGVTRNFRKLQEIAENRNNGKIMGSYPKVTGNHGKLQEITGNSATSTVHSL